MLYYPAIHTRYKVLVQSQRTWYSRGGSQSISLFRIVIVTKTRDITRDYRDKNSQLLEYFNGFQIEVVLHFHFRRYTQITISIKYTI